MTQTPAGWFPDPSGEDELRYWDGAGWTAHVAAAPAAVQPVTPTPPPGPTTPDGERLAGWWWRVLAVVIDGFIIGIATNILSAPAQFRIQQDLTPALEQFDQEFQQNPDQFPDLGVLYDAFVVVMQDNWFWLTVPSAVVVVLYWAVFLRWKGATPGKLILGLRVRLRERPGRLPWGSISARLVLPIIVPQAFYVVVFAVPSWELAVAGALAIVVIYLLDALWATWDPQRQTIHDKLAGTNVVKAR